MHRGRVTKHVRRDVLPLQARTSHCRPPHGLLQDVIHTVARQRASAHVWEGPVSPELPQFTKPGLQHTRRLWPQWNGSLLPSFAHQIEKGAGAEIHLILSQCRQLGEARAAVVESQQKRLIASPDPLRPDQRQLKLFQRQLKLFSMTIETPVL